MREYLCSYYLDGERWSLVIRADSFDDAQRRLHAIGNNGTVDGEALVSVMRDTKFSRWAKSLRFWKWEA